MIESSPRGVIALDASNIAIGPGTAICVTARLPLELAMLAPDTFTFADPELWTIHEFSIGNHSQLHRAPVPAAELASALRAQRDAVQIGMDVVMIASHHGDGSRAFRCEIAGDAILAPGGRGASVRSLLPS